MILPLLAIAQLRPDLPSWSAFPGDAAVSVGSEHVHDPTVVNLKGTWFAFSTSGNGFGVIRSSKDLRTWRVHGPFETARPAWLDGRYRHRSIWAPDILVVGSVIRAYYCASDFGTNRSVIGLLENGAFDPANPGAGWVDKGLVLETKPGDAPNAIDPETFIDSAGRHHLVFGSYFGGIYEIGLDAATGLPVQGETPQIVAVNSDERGNPLEGAAIARRGGWTYLFVSYGLAAQGVRSTYRIMVGRSKSPTGPFLDAKGKPMSEGGHTEVLKGSPPMFSPGHCDVLQAPDGRWLLPYHFYDGRSYWGDGKWGLPRLQIRELLWSADGWPLPGLPVEFPHPDGTASTLKPGVWTLQRDFGEPVGARLSADGTLTMGKELGAIRRKGDATLLTLPGEPDSVTVPPVTLPPVILTVAYDGTYAVGRDVAGHVVRLARTGP